MSSIEERLTRDIAAVTGGVVMTESDLRDARGAVDERITSRRQTDRRRGVIGVAAAAVLVLALGVAAFLSRGGDDETAPPAAPSPSARDLLADFLVGSAPTPELLQGVWRVDNGTEHLRFSLPNLFASDDGGRLFGKPGVFGTYEITGDRITVKVDGGTAGCAGQEFAMRASVPGPGAVRVVHTQPGTGGCAQSKNGTMVLEQVLPASPAMAGLVYSTESGWQPLVSKRALYGLWLAEGGGHVLEIDPGGTYYVADDSGEPVDRGQWSLRRTDLTLTSSAESAQCSAGDRLVLGAVEQVAGPGTRAGRSTVQENTCGAAWAPAVWILIPHEGS